jgi:hypothetical protein
VTVEPFRPLNQLFGADGRTQQATLAPFFVDFNPRHNFVLRATLRLIIIINREIRVFFHALLGKYPIPHFYHPDLTYFIHKITTSGAF